MKLATCFLVAAWSVFGQQAAELCSVEGQVLSTSTGAPIRKAELTLRSQGRQQATYTAQTDAGGKFAITDVVPGKYRLSARRTGFVSGEYGARAQDRPGTLISLEPGQPLKDLRVQLVPQAVIAGKVVDENNEPAVSVQVSAMHYVYRGGRKREEEARTAATNDLGEYRLYGLAPGRYYLMARYVSYDAPAVDRSVVPTASSYVPTYYPATNEAATASPIEAGAGMQLRGITITLARARTFHVRGHLSEIPESGHQSVSIMLNQRGQPARLGMGDAQHSVDAKDNFDIAGLQPGEYTLVAYCWTERKAYSGRQDVNIGEEDADGVQIPLSPPTELIGTVAVEGSATPDLTSVMVSLFPRDTSQSWLVTSQDRVKDGAFTITGVTPGLYDLQIINLPDGYWLKSVRMGDEEVKNSGIDLTRGPPGPVRVTIAPNAGQIDGVIQDEGRTAAAATVVLVPESALRDRMDAYRNTVADQQGHFTIKNVAPGEYKLFAWEDVEYGAYMDPDFLRPVESRGESVSIHESSHETVQLTLIPADATAKTQRQDK